MNLNAIFFASVFILSLNPSLYGTVICPLLMLLLLLFLLDMGVLILTFVLFIAQFGYLHKTRPLCICCCSSSICCWLEQMCLALCKRVLMMLYLFAMAWWLSHCKYWLVWVGFLYTVYISLGWSKNQCSLGSIIHP